MNIVIVLEATLGGTRKHVVDLIKGLSPVSHRITFIYATRRADDRFASDIKDIKLLNNVSCIRLPMTKSVLNPLNIYSALLMAMIFRSARVDVVHLHGAVAGALGRLAAFGNKRIKKIVYSPHGGVMHKMNGSIAGKIYALIEKKLTTSNVSFVAVSNDEKQKLSAALTIAASKIQLIPNGINLHELIGQKCTDIELKRKRQLLGLLPDDFVLLYPALFLEAKGHTQFFKTFVDKGLKLSPRVQILLAGDGPLRSRIEQLISQSTLRCQIHFLGFQKEINPLFQLADAVMLPSVNEAFGYVLVEAMAFGKPVFATDVGGIREVVEHKRNGFLYHPADLASMINDINRHAEDPFGLSSFATHATTTVAQKFDIRYTIERMTELYKF